MDESTRECCCCILEFSKLQESVLWNRWRKKGTSHPYRHISRMLWWFSNSVRRYASYCINYLQLMCALLSGNAPNTYVWSCGLLWNWKWMVINENYDNLTYDNLFFFFFNLRLLNDVRSSSYALERKLWWCWWMWIRVSSCCYNLFQ